MYVEGYTHKHKHAYTHTHTHTHTYIYIYICIYMLILFKQNVSLISNETGLKDWLLPNNTYATPIYIYIYIYGGCLKEWLLPNNTYATPTHTHIYIYIYIYILVNRLVLQMLQKDIIYFFDAIANISIPNSFLTQGVLYLPLCVEEILICIIVYPAPFVYSLSVY